jgi:hypothetical protein
MYVRIKLVPCIYGIKVRLPVLYLHGYIIIISLLVLFTVLIFLSDICPKLRFHKIVPSFSRADCRCDDKMDVNFLDLEKMTILFTGVVPSTGNATADLSKCCFEFPFHWVSPP